MISAITAIDLSVLQWFYQLRDVTTLGSYIFIGLSTFADVYTILGLTLVVILLLALNNRRNEIAGLMFSVTGTGIVVEILNWLVHRPRPSLQLAAYDELGFSFPSGHAAASVALYFFLVFLITRIFPHSIKRNVLRAILLLLPFLISFARVYLGVHYVSDVIAGMIIGAVFVWGGIMLTHRLEKRKGTAA